MAKGTFAYRSAHLVPMPRLARTNNSSSWSHVAWPRLGEWPWFRGRVTPLALNTRQALGHDRRLHNGLTTFHLRDAAHAGLVVWRCIPHHGSLWLHGWGFHCPVTNAHWRLLGLARDGSGRDKRFAARWRDGAAFSHVLRRSCS